MKEPGAGMGGVTVTYGGNGNLEFIIINYKV